MAPQNFTIRSDTVKVKLLLKLRQYCDTPVFGEFEPHFDPIFKGPDSKNLSLSRVQIMILCTYYEFRPFFIYKITPHLSSKQKMLLKDSLPDEFDYFNLKGITMSMNTTYETMGSTYNRMRNEKELGVVIRVNSGRPQVIVAEVDKVIIPLYHKILLYEKANNSLQIGYNQVLGRKIHCHIMTRYRK